MRTISIPTHNRPQILKRCLESIRAAVGSANWTLVFSCEPNPETRRVISTVSWAPIHVTENDRKMGCWINTFLAANYAMTLGSDLNLYLEDDFVISKDALTLVDQFNLSDFQVLCLRRPENTVTDEPAKVTSFSGGLVSNGFSWRKDLWTMIRSLWFCRHVSLGFNMWDWSMEYGLGNERISQCRPCLNRSQGIGLVGTHQTQYDPNMNSPCYSGPPVSVFEFSP